MSKYIVYSVETGSFYEHGFGFSVGQESEATKFDTEAEALKIAEVAELMGLGVAEVLEAEDEPAKVEEGVEAGDCGCIQQNDNGRSFAVSFIRKSDVGDGGVRPNRNNPSTRRFKTLDEANHHGVRFAKIEGHIGHYVTETYDPVNAFVNKVTGKTNPVIGRGRQDR